MIEGELLQQKNEEDSSDDEDTKLITSQNNFNNYTFLFAFTFISNMCTLCRKCAISYCNILHFTFGLMNIQL